MYLYFLRLIFGLSAREKSILYIVLDLETNNPCYGQIICQKIGLLNSDLHMQIAMLVFSSDSCVGKNA